MPQKCLSLIIQLGEIEKSLIDEDSSIFILHEVELEQNIKYIGELDTRTLKPHGVGMMIDQSSTYIGTFEPQSMHAIKFQTPR